MNKAEKSRNATRPNYNKKMQEWRLPTFEEEMDYIHKGIANAVANGEFRYQLESHVEDDIYLEELKREGYEVHHSSASRYFGWSVSWY